MIERRRLGRTGLQVSCLGFGGAPIGLLATEVAEAGRILNAMLDAGVTLIDTAAVYGASESVIARTIGHRREEIVLVSKCGRPLDDLDGTAWSTDHIARTIERSLRRLATDHIDVMLLHSPKLEILRQGEAVAALAKAKREGKIRHLGFAGDGAAAAYAAALPDVEVIEMTANLYDQANLEQPAAGAAAHDIGIIAKRALANAAWDDLSWSRFGGQNGG